MRNATISTSRTRATTATPLIDYRPLPAAWGDLDALHAARVARHASEATPFTRELDRLAESPAPAEAPAARSASRARRPLLSSLLRAPGVHRRPRPAAHLATA